MDTIDEARAALRLLLAAARDVRYSDAAIGNLFRLDLERWSLLAGDMADELRWRVFDQTVNEVQARNASVPAEQIESEIDEALAAVRTRRND